MPMVRPRNSGAKGLFLSNRHPRAGEGALQRAGGLHGRVRAWLRKEAWVPVLLGLIIPLGLSFPAAADGLTLMTENFAPYNFVEDGRLKGICTNIVREIIRRLGQETEIRVLPWPRAYRLLQETDNCALFSTARTPSRENLFRWVGPLVEYDVSLYKKKGGNVDASTQEKALRYLVGVKRDTAGHQWLMDHGFHRIYLDYTSDSYPLPEMLIKGRIDLWLMGDFAAVYMARASGVNPAMLERALVLFQQDLYIAFSRSTDDATIGAWQKALDGIKADGTQTRILREYRIE